MLTNRIESDVLILGNINNFPAIGGLATIVSDDALVPATIIAIAENAVTIRISKSFRLDKNGVSKRQKYEIVEDPNGNTITFNRSGRYWKNEDDFLVVGVQAAYKYYPEWAWEENEDEDECDIE